MHHKSFTWRTVAPVLVKSTGSAPICTCIHRLNRSSFTTTDDSVANRKLAAGTAGRKTNGASRECFFTPGKKSSRRRESDADGQQSQRDENRRKPKIGYWSIRRCNGRRKSDTHRRLCRRCNVRWKLEVHHKRGWWMEHTAQAGCLEAGGRRWTESPM
jgi:hypothetical protein